MVQVKLHWERIQGLFYVIADCPCGNKVRLEIHPYELHKQANCEVCHTPILIVKHIAANGRIYWTGQTGTFEDATKEQFHFRDEGVMY